MLSFGCNNVKCGHGLSVEMVFQLIKTADESDVYPFGGIASESFIIR